MTKSVPFELGLRFEGKIMTWEPRRRSYAESAVNTVSPRMKYSIPRIPVDGWRQAICERNASLCRAELLRDRQYLDGGH